MLIIFSWKVRGLNTLNKQKEDKIICNKEKVNLICLLETNIKCGKIEKLVESIFFGRRYVTHLERHKNGRIWLTWRPNYYSLNLIDMAAQQVTCEVKFIPLQLFFQISYAYPFNSREDRKELWERLLIQSNRCIEA